MSLRSSETPAELWQCTANGGSCAMRRPGERKNRLGTRVLRAHADDFALTCGKHRPNPHFTQPRLKYACRLRAFMVFIPVA